MCLWEITRVFGKNNLVPTVTQVLTLPMAVYVDGNCLMGPCRGRVDAEMHSFQAWALDVVA